MQLVCKMQYIIMFVLNGYTFCWLSPEISRHFAKTAGMFVGLMKIGNTAALAI